LPRKTVAPVWRSDGRIVDGRSSLFNNGLDNNNDDNYDCCRPTVTAGLQSSATGRMQMRTRRRQAEPSVV